MTDEIFKNSKSHAIYYYWLQNFSLSNSSLWQYIQTFDTETNKQERKKNRVLKIFNFHTFEQPNLAKSSSNYRYATNATAINK